MFEDYVTPQRKHELAMQRVTRIAEDAYANFLVGRGFQAQGETEMAEKHFQAVESLDLALHAVLQEAVKWEPKDDGEAEPYGHDH